MVAEQIAPGVASEPTARETLRSAISIAPASRPDAGEILTVQRAAYVTEAQLYDDVRLPALTQTLEELADELGRVVCLKATLWGRLVGAVRGRVESRPDGAVFAIGRLVVVPDLQGYGIGSRLLREIEHKAPEDVSRFALFTGHLSAGNLALYQRHGYAEVRREPVAASVVLVHLEKPRPVRGSTAAG